MPITENAKKYHEKMFPGYESDFLRTDPEFIERFDNFALDEVVNQKGQATSTTENRRELGIQAQGGCEPQLISHAAGNMKVGNDKAFLIKVISQCLPYIGYPRSLNALACVNKVAENLSKE